MEDNVNLPANGIRRPNAREFQDRDRQSDAPFVARVDSDSAPRGLWWGFAEGRRYRSTSQHSLRHAWRAAASSEGWVRVDPVAAVAPERISLGLGESAAGATAGGAAGFAGLGWARQLSLAWDAVNTVWNEWIIGYGPTLQRNLFSILLTPGLRSPSTGSEN